MTQKPVTEAVCYLCGQPILDGEAWNLCEGVFTHTRCTAQASRE